LSVTRLGEVRNVGSAANVAVPPPPGIEPFTQFAGPDQNPGKLAAQVPLVWACDASVSAAPAAAATRTAHRHRRLALPPLRMPLRYRITFGETTKFRSH
jgi:hypothetical protein